MKESNTLRNIQSKRYLSANGSLLLPLALKWRLVRIIACSLFVALVLPCLGGGSVSAASITLTVPGRLTLTVAADGAFHESATAATVSVKSDAYSGYTLGVKSGESTSPALKNGSNTIPSISSAMAGSSFPVNTWGWLPSKLGGQANSQYQPGPTSTLVTIEKTTSPNASTANSYTVKLGAKVNGTIPAGTYVNTFTFTATANPVPYTITYQGESAPGKQTGSGMEGTQITLAGAPTRDNYEFKGWCTVSTSNETCTDTTYAAGGKYTLTNSANNVTLYAMWKQNAFLGDLGDMQSFTCAKIPNIGQYGTVRDIRDDSTYRVRKLADGNCWMIDNLRLGDSKLQNRTLTSHDTDLNNGLTTYTLPGSNQDGFNSNNYNVENIYVVETDSEDGKEQKVYGGYYSWGAATAGTGADIDQGYGDAPSSICPKGWRLPTAHSSDSDFEVLNDALGTPSDGDKDAYWTNPDGPAFLRAGYYYNGGTATDQGNRGEYWSSTSAIAPGNVQQLMSSNLAFSDSYAGSSGMYRHDGLSVRCVARHSSELYSITYNLNGGSGGPYPNPQEGAKQGSTITLDKNTPNKCGYKFWYWCSVDNTDDPTNCAGTRYSPGGSYDLSNGAAITLYAMWWNTTGTDLGNLGNMQSFTCSKIPSIGDFGTVTDTRDNNTYCVRKLKDDKCWMTDNLRLGDSKLKERTLTSANTNLNSIDSYPLPESSKDGFKMGNSAVQNIYVVEADDGDEKKIYGGYYTYNTATAGTGASVTSNNENAPSSICPKGWRLPTDDTNSDFKALNNALGGITNSDEHLMNLDGPAFLRAGGYYNSKPTSAGNGYYWSSTASSSSNAYTLNFTSTRVLPANSSTRYRGYSIRCIAVE